MAFNARSANHIGESKYSVVGNTENGITAHAGGGQASAYLLRAQLSIIETAANAADSVKLPRISTTPNLLGSLNSLMIVSNTTAHAVQVFGSSPDKIDGAATGTGVSLPAGQSATFFVANFTTPFDQSAGTGEWVSTIVTGGGGGGIAIGDPVGGGDPNVVLVLDGSGNLAQDAGLTFTVGQFDYYRAGAGVATYFGTDTDSTSGAFVLDEDAAAALSQVRAAGGYAAFGYTGTSQTPNNTWGLHNGLGAVLEFNQVNQDVTLPSLAGTGNRGTFADATGLLSAPAVLQYDAQRNYIFGKFAGTSLSGGSNNIIIGDGAGEAITTGFRNTVVGNNALVLNVTGKELVAIGFRSLEDCTVDGNTAVGAYSSLEVTTGARNTSVGYLALGTNLTGTDNVSVGDNAMSNDLSSNNVSVGSGTLSIGDGGGHNTAVGAFALQHLTTGADDVAVGYHAGITVTTGGNNVFVGSGADGIAAGSNQIALGQGVACTASNQMRLGNASITSTHITGIVNLSGKFYPVSIGGSEQSGVGLYAMQSGVPSNADGSDGDFILSAEGHIYWKTGGMWAVLI